jgi:hypothetical protein
LFWLPIGLLRTFARYLGIKALSASMWHYSPRFRIHPSPRSAWEGFRDLILPAFVVTYPVLYLWLYNGDAREWVTQFGLWLVLGVAVVSYALYRAKDTARTYLISAGGFVLGVASIPLFYELARMLNKLIK